MAAERIRAEGDLAHADRWEARARTKDLSSTRTRSGAGGELIDIENRWDALGVVDTVVNPNYVTAAASRDRLAPLTTPGMRPRTTWAISMPDQIGVARDLLAHADLRTTIGTTIGREGIEASRAYRQLIAGMRRKQVRRTS